MYLLSLDYIFSPSIDQSHINKHCGVNGAVFGPPVVGGLGPAPTPEVGGVPVNGPGVTTSGPGVGGVTISSVGVVGVGAGVVVCKEAS